MKVLREKYLLLRHLLRIGAGGYEFSFQMLLLLFRRELSWDDSNRLWDAVLAQHVILKAKPGFRCPGCLREADNLTDGINRQQSQGAQLDSAVPILNADAFRLLSIAVAVALLMTHRKALLGCRRLEDVVQLVNRLPDQGKRSGLKIASMASKIMTENNIKRSALVTLTCGCIRPGAAL